MTNVTLRMSDELVAELDDEADTKGTDRSKLIRDTLATRHETSVSQDEYDSLQAQCRDYEQKIENLRNELAELEREVERQQRERRQLLEQRDEHTELVATVERQQSLQERRAQAGLFTKLRWSLTGMPAEG